MGNYIQKFTGLFLAAFLLTITSVIAQAPLGFNYQGVALTNAGTPVSNKVISLRIALIESQQLGTTRFQETHNVNTDAYGQFSVIIGNGQATTGKMSDVQWSKFPYYMKVELDLNGGTAYVFVGTSQLLSVPYALYANNAGAASISVDSLKNELTTIRLVQRGDSIVLNNNKGAIYIPKIDSLSKIVAQFAGIKSGVIKYIRDSATKTPYGLAIGYDALKGMDTLAVNANNYAIGNGAGGSLLKNKDNSSNNDNILIGTASGATLGTTASGGAMQNVIIGNNAGQNAKADATGNVLVGYEAGKNSVGSVGSKTVQYSQNVAVGTSSLQNAKNAGTNVSIGANNLKLANDVSRNVSIGANTALNYNGDDNVILGTEMLYDTSSNGSKNVIIGAAVATNLRGSGNVILGYKAAEDSIFLNISNRLIIANNKTKKPLIYGEFDNKKVTINGDLTVTGKLNGASGSIDPIVKYGTNASDTIYLDSDVDVYKTADGVWNRNIFLPIPNSSNNFLSKRINSTILISSGSSFSFNIKKDNTNLKNDILINTNDFVSFVYDGNKWLLLSGNNTLINSNGTASANIIVGQDAGQELVGDNNIAIGKASMQKTTLGEYNIAIGTAALNTNKTGGKNTAIGYNSLTSNTTSNFNTSVGATSMFKNTTGSSNTAFGTNALFSNLTGSTNTAIGASALYFNTTANNNVAVGYESMNNNTTGDENISIGVKALYSNKTGGKNIAIGSSAYASHINKQQADGDKNIAIGYLALNKDTSGVDNTALGAYSMAMNISGKSNIGVGNFSLQANTTGSGNVAIAPEAMRFNTTGFNNIAIGYASLYRNTTGFYNTAVGYGALTSNTTGTDNEAIGNNVLRDNTIGSANTGFGGNALLKNTSGSRNIAIGHAAYEKNLTGSTNVIIGAYSGENLVNGNSNTFLGNNVAQSWSSGSNNVIIGSNVGNDSSLLNLNNKLLIGNTNTRTPLIYGDFSNKKLKFNADIDSLSILNRINFVDENANDHINKYDTGYSSPLIYSRYFYGHYGDLIIQGMSKTYTGNIHFVTGSNIAGFDPPTQRMVIMDNGNVGIGNFAPFNPPTSKLQVTGNVLATGYKTPTGTSSQYLMADGSVSSGTSTSTVIPYTGATKAVDLGAYDLKVNGLTIGVGAGGDASNTALGNNSLNSNTPGALPLGSGNTAVGNKTLESNTSGWVNTAIGQNALKSNTTGAQNTAIGASSLVTNTTGAQNTAIGLASLAMNTTGSNNSALGFNSLFNLTSGLNNSAFGNYTGNNLTTGSDNILIGANSDVSSGNISNTIVIGRLASVSSSNTVTIGNSSTNKWVFGIPTTTNVGYAFQVGSSSSNGNGAYLTNGGTWTNGSSILYKEGFEEIDGNQILDKIEKMSITKWRYKGTNEVHIGPIAEDFKQLFNLGVIGDNMHISTVDASGVALKAIQILGSENKILKNKNKDLEERLKSLEFLVQKLIEKNK
jgi:hypothetical protein